MVLTIRSESLMFCMNNWTFPLEIVQKFQFMWQIAYAIRKEMRNFYV